MKKEILEYVYNYYSELYEQPISLADKREEERTLTLVDQLVSEEDNLRLMEVPGVEELKDTIKNLPLGKSPGEDGLSVEVLREIWDEISPCCLEFIQEAWHSKLIGNFNTGAIIKLLPKSERQEELCNWHPILLLNLAYKLVGRILAKRLKSIIPKLVDEEQIGFIHERSITDNIISLGLCQELAVAHSEPVTFCKLDFVKVFDKVQHSFLWATMRRMGFSPAVIELTRALVSEGHAKVHLNGRYTKSFKVERGVRQGCPISPLLFAISTQPLMCFLREGERKGELVGVNISRGRTLLHRLFVDDSGMAIKANEGNFISLCRIVENFERISGAQLNPAKSVIIPFALERSLEWLQETGYQILNRGQYITYLRCFSVKKAEEERAKDLRNKIQQRLGKWTCRFLTWTSHVLLLQHVLRAIPVYQFLGLGLHRNSYKQLEAPCWAFLWGINTDSSTKTPLVSWDSITKLKKNGGLQIRPFQRVSDVLKMKYFGRLMSGEQ
ncbi:hypothetical protein R1flu_005083 [Riccia fluitans]|uniref:Reverse transcriptase domain-containing protein n=1 Tax=Riccia fluitans TaxID=41844 RepID=A0ABD1YS48_9MARC